MNSNDRGNNTVTFYGTDSQAEVISQSRGAVSYRFTHDHEGTIYDMEVSKFKKLTY